MKVRKILKPVKELFPTFPEPKSCLFCGGTDIRIHILAYLPEGLGFIGLYCMQCGAGVWEMFDFKVYSVDKLKKEKIEPYINSLLERWNHRYKRTMETITTPDGESFALSCPLCPPDADINSWLILASSTHSQLLSPKDVYGADVEEAWTVGCVNCGLEGPPGTTVAEAIELWNRTVDNEHTPTDT